MRPAKRLALHALISKRGNLGIFSIIRFTPNFSQEDKNLKKKLKHNLIEINEDLMKSRNVTRV